MKRLFLLLRASLLPLLALAGIALLAWGAVGWWTFYRELFVEELAAIAKLAGDEGEVTYRRQGETNPRTYDAIEKVAEPIPWSVPFIGRAEFAQVSDRAATPDDGTHLALGSLPLRGLVGETPATAYGVIRSWRTERDLPLAFPLPALPSPQLQPADLLAPWPSGEPVTVEELRDIALRMAAALAHKPSSPSRIERTATTSLLGPDQTPALRSWSLRIDDSDRRFEFDSEGFSVWNDCPDVRYANVLVRSNDAIYAFYDDEGAAGLAVAVARDLQETQRQFRDEVRDEAYSGKSADGLQLYQASLGDAVGADGEHTVRGNRIDEDRLLIECEPPPTWDGDDTKTRLRAIVREDLDDAIERWEVRRTSEEKTFLVSHLLHLERGQDETIVVERLSAKDVLEGLSDPWTPLAHPPEVEARSLRVVAYDQEVGETPFDPRSYRPDWPERPELPALRTYRVAVAAGATLLATAAGGLLLSTLRHRTRREVRTTSAGRPRFVFRFGLATLFGFALLVVSVAGWIKQRVDEAKEQLVLLGKLDEEGYGCEIERRSPGFPWMFFSTDALPLDAPPVRLRVAEDPAPAILEEMFRTWPEIEFRCDPFEGRGDDDERFRRPVVGANVEALGGNAPELRDLEPSADPSSSLPAGERLEGEALARVVESAVAAWHAAGRDRPTRYVVRQEIQGDVEDDRITVRDGERWRIGDGDPRSDVEWMELGDGRSRRRFSRDLDQPPWEKPVDWRLAFQRPLRPSEGPTTASVLSSARREWEYLDEAQAGFCDEDLEGPDRQPMHEARLPRAPYCLPPCIDSVWAPPLDEALHRIDRANVVAAERIDANRVRFDLRFPTDRSQDEPTEERPAIQKWSIIARSDLGWTVERCDYVDEVVRTLPFDVEWSADGYEPTWKTRTARRRREIVVCNTLRSDDESFPYAGAAFRCRELEGSEAEGSVDASVRYAVDLAPSFSDKVFDRPTTDWPDPYPPEPDRSFPWPLVTSVIGVLCVASGPIVRRLSRRTSRAPGEPADEAVT